MDDLITPEQAEAIVLADPPALQVEEVALELATGRVLARSLVADRPLPPYHRVMMDGIAFRSSDLTGEAIFPVAGVHAAGAPDPGTLPAGHCWEIMTGACLPSACDTVVPYEETSRPDPGHIAVRGDSIHPGKFIHRLGSDFAAGETLVPAHLPVDSRIAAVAATVGATSLPVLRRPRVAIFTTGDELVPPHQSPAPHQVRQSNHAALRAALQRLGAEIVHESHLPDDAELTRTAVAGCRDADLLLLCGGISKGKYDFVRPVIESLHGVPAFHGIAQRPGKPLAFWTGSPPVFALPGNPMSVLVCFHRYVRPYLDALLHRPRRARTVALAHSFSFPPPLSYFLPVELDHSDATVRATPHPLANSGDFASSIGSDGFIELPPDRDEFPEGFLAPFHEWL